MVIPNYSSRDMYEKMYAMCVSQYGQMTAGSYCYIGPQVYSCYTDTVQTLYVLYLTLNLLLSKTLLTSMQFNANDDVGHRSRHLPDTHECCP
jgi:urocanate hydratase